MTTALKILIVADDRSVSKVVAAYLGKEGYDPRSVDSVPELQRIFAEIKPDMVILDVMLSGEDGWGALRWIRARSQVPVIMLTGKGETVGKRAARNLGAEDCLSKPLDSSELLARLRTLQRRIEQPNGAGRSKAAKELSGELRFHGWVLDLMAQQLKNERGEIVHLTLAEYRVLVALTSTPRQVITREQLTESVSGRNWDPLDRSIDVHVSNLRRKLESDPRHSGLIRTVRGSGYMFVPN